jgi:hypothetical protein
MARVPLGPTPAKPGTAPQRQRALPHRAERHETTTEVSPAMTLLPRGSAILAHMGFNPHRKQVRRTSDYVFVVAGIAAALAAVLWVVLG